MATSPVMGTLNDQTTHLLRDRILSGELLPGARILEIDLARELGVSRGTLRAALQQLGFEGLVVQKRFRSSYVTALTARDCYEIYTLRNTLEAMATQLAAAHISNAGRLLLDASLDVMATAVRQENRSGVVEADYSFHQCIFELTGHARLQAHYKMIEPQTRLYLRLTATLDYDLEYILKIHRDIARSVKDGDVAGAEALARNHNTQDGERMAAMLREAEAAESSEEVGRTSKRD